MGRINQLKMSNDGVNPKRALKTTSNKKKESWGGCQMMCRSNNSKEQWKSESEKRKRGNKLKWDNSSEVVMNTGSTKLKDH